jgi:signal transduction histidine kinase
MIDSMRFEMILINLISNAIKYSPKNSKVELKVLVVDLADQGRAVVEVKVIDSGIGISENE